MRVCHYVGVENVNLTEQFAKKTKNRKQLEEQFSKNNATKVTAKQGNEILKVNCPEKKC